MEQDKNGMEKKGVIIMYKCCIFDLDGTLVNSIYALKRSVDLTLEHFGMGPITIEDTKQFVGDGYKKLVERSLAAYGDKELTHYKEALDIYNEVFKGCCLYKVEAYKGIPELLAFLKDNEILITVLSNKPHQRALENVYHVFGENYFDRVYGEREAQGIKKKPAPDGVVALIEELGLKKEECLYLGDTNTDMKTGQAAQVDTVGVTWGFRPREELEAFAPKLVADTPFQVIDFIKAENHIE